MARFGNTPVIEGSRVTGPSKGGGGVGRGGNRLRAVKIAEACEAVSTLKPRYAGQHFLYFLPLPHGQGSLRPALVGPLAASRSKAVKLPGSPMVFFSASIASSRAHAQSRFRPKRSA